jgi:hypothetical protein
MPNSGKTGDEKPLRWCEVDAGERKVPAWLRSAALATDGTAFIPAAVVGSELDEVLSAEYDSVTIVRYRGHAYVPADWIRREYPQATDLSIRIERGVREHLASKSPF